MAVRQLGQLSLADAIAVGGGRSAVALDRLGRLIDWSRMAATLGPVHSSPRGAPGYPAELMIKVLMLQQWYGLSDPAMEDALCDRLSFRRFAGLSLDERGPDHSTISRFRTFLSTKELTEALFKEVTRQIDVRGLILRQGTMIDATLVEAQVKRPRRPTDEATDEADGQSADTDAAGTETTDMQSTADVRSTGKTAEPNVGDAKGAPEHGVSEAAIETVASATADPKERPPSKLVGSPVDRDASWAKKGGRRYFGYKGHVAVDLGSRIIRKAVLTTASVQDTVLGDDLMMGDERAIYADAAYDKKARRAALKARGVKDRICHRGNRHHPITARQEQHNKAIGRRRGQVEQVFANAKRLLGWRRVRYVGLIRNAGHFHLLCTAMNLNRLLVLTG